MTGEEAKDAMKRAVPVLCKGFGSIDGAVIYRQVDGQERVSVELQDKRSHSSAIVDARHVSLKR